MVTRRLAEFLLRSAVRRWPAGRHDELSREWRAELHVLAERGERWRMLRFAASLAASRAGDPAVDRARFGARARRTAATLLLAPPFGGVPSDFLRSAPWTPGRGLLWRTSGTICGVPVAAGRVAVHSDRMSDDGSGGHYYWCTRHHRVETDADVCPAKHVLGPYASVADAEDALQTVRERNEAWDAEDARWAGEDR